MRNFDFNLCDACVDEIEGKYSDVAADKGGATKYGITQQTLDAYCDKHSLTRFNVSDLQIPKASQIYKELYWMPAVCDQLPNELKLMHYHFVVNHGVEGANKMLQGLVGAVQDGNIGPVTLQMIGAVSPSKLTVRLAAAQLRWYADDWVKNPSQVVFENGWDYRVCRVLQMVYYQ